jgi:hypothetical protein
MWLLYGSSAEWHQLQVIFHDLLRTGPDFGADTEPGYPSNPNSIVFEVSLRSAIHLNRDLKIQ